ncbi:2,3-bisphosphoglycerate-dependent phosphoglycerate mutase [Stenomitos frigidus]|uniref:2,3-bisphosphoglycerate-dependent phosphoglycerate mutase n=1 Tax=Stenomitos frigidus ULC18 TaxID=2107698 RepID=A0A2T1E0Y6_9CYAN|nr:2,3-bisphosphoglycerate-dependent phosphoglycerate mutase [Stenomitos frigidus]PSB26389.1 2,3-bisphosphoglycerate-dependent phosphoglycerate mutase [Stenomitos frigidus ULC18]
MAKLILVRHGQSLWNAENKFTGWVDVPLGAQGRAEATIAADKLETYRVRVCFTSLLFRAIETAIIILTEGDDLCDGRIPIIKHDVDDEDWHGWDKYKGDPEQELPVYLSSRLDERYYGELQGLNKAETAVEFGTEQVQLWRRSYAVAPPGGESLEATVKRTVPFFRDRILKHLMDGDNVLIAAHGNSLRAIIMHLEKLTEAAIVNVEIGTGIPIIYDLNANGQVTDKVILH